MATNRITNMSYIGKTTRSLVVRRKDHYRLAMSTKNTYFSRVLALYFEEDFEWRILFESDDSAVLAEKEQVFIMEYGTYAPNGYNMSFGGEGVRFLPEKRKALSEFWKNKYQEDLEFVAKRNEAIRKYWDEQNSIEGIFEKRSEIAKKRATDPIWQQHCRDAWTEEAKKKVAEKTRARMQWYRENDPEFFQRRADKCPPLTEAQRKHRSELGKKRFQDPEFLKAHIERIKAAAKTESWIAKNKIQWELHKKPIICIETGEYFGCSKDATDKFGTTRRNINGVLCKRQHTTAGHTFRYATEVEIVEHKGGKDVSKSA